MATPNKMKSWMSMPEPPINPPGYKSTPEEQIDFLEEIQRKHILNNKFKLAELPNTELEEALYYASHLKIPKIEKVLMEERVRRSATPFRPPLISRPNMPEQARIPETDYLNLLIQKIYLPKTPSEQKGAYDTFIDVFLTDWVNRKGFVNSKGQQMAYTPYFDNAKLLTGIESHIEKLLKTQMLEKPNPGTINKRRGNSIRQQYFKDILERIKKRITLLQEEEFNRVTKIARNKKGGRRTYKNKYYKRKTRRN
jgi:hypothetical protein